MTYTPAGRFAHPPALLAAAVLLAAGAPFTRADVLNDIGITALRNAQPTLTGTGVTVAQVEASEAADPNDLTKFEVNDTATHGIPTTYVNNAGQSATTFPNAIGVESGHADLVGSNFFGNAGVAPNVSSVFNIEATFYFGHFIYFNDIPVPNPKVVNQSFGFIINDDPTQALYEQLYDNYVVQHGTIFINGAGNGGHIIFPATMMNGIAVGVYGSPSSTGPTIDGRSKPDVVVPEGATSYAAGLVSGVSAVLVQAGNNNLGGAGTSATATDPRTIKVLLESGAVKPAGWSHTQNTPLDQLYGAGIVNAFSSYQILAAGRANSTVTTVTAALGDAHPAINTGATVKSKGWNLKTITSTTSGDAVDHYLMDLTGNNGMVYMATLTWYHPFSSTVASHADGATPNPINNLDLYLYDANTNSLVTSSTSSVDNLEHLYITTLQPGRYDLQVLKRGGITGDPGIFSQLENYSIAWRTTLLGDANFDNKVDAFDLNILAANWQDSSGALWTTGDFNNDGKVDAFDLNALAANWQNPGLSLAAALQSYPFLPGALTTTTVPEPTTALLLGLGAITVLRTRTRRRN